MKKLDKNQLDEIGKALVRTDAVLSRDLESVVADPALFDSVRARIASEPPLAPRRRAYLPARIAAFATLTVIAAFAFVVVISKKQPSEIAVRPLPAAPISANNVARFTEPDRIVNNERPSVVHPVRSERTVGRPVVRSIRPQRPEAQQAQPETSFYAVSYTGDPHETERGGRIVRVDIPRSTLFAMGVDIPLENEAEVVKADLLIGPDGVTRGIRVVK